MSPPGHVSISQQSIIALQNSCVWKSLLFFLNVSLVFVGAFIVGMTCTVHVEVNKLDNRFLLILDDKPEIMTGLYVILATGVIVLIVGFGGCLSSLCEQEDYNVTLVLFTIVVTVMIIVQISAFLLAFIKLPEVEVVLRDSMKFVNVPWISLDATDKEVGEYLKELDHYSSTQTREEYTLAWVKLQSEFECCGYDSPQDWMQVLSVPAYAAYCTESALEDLTASFTTTRFSFDGTTNRTESFQNHVLDLSQQLTWPYGCKKIVFGKLATHMVITFIVALIVEVIVIVVSFYLICKIARERKRVTVK